MKESKMSADDSSVHFREHDVEFLQKRTKLWLETVLGETYGDRPLAELISDGNLLYRVSKHITREMTGASPGPQEMSPKTLAQVSVFGKNSGKYLPYANVDSFLKTCRKVGLTDVELFTPPDAVEGKDIRRICTSIRSLARKARAQHIRVPDFEDVNRPLPMPKEKIVEIKGNLQHSHSSPVTPKVATPEADIIKSERVQIISRFLSSTNPLYLPEEDNGSRPPSEPPSPVTPGPLKSPFTKNSSLSTPTATVGGVDTPVLTKSVSVIEPSPSHVKSSGNRFAQSMLSDEPRPDKTPKTPSPSPALPVDQPNDSPSPFSQKSLGSFRHAQPHFVKKSSSQSNITDLADDSPVEVPPPHPKPEKTPSSPGISAPSTQPVSKPSTPDVSKSPTPAFSETSAPAVAKPSTPSKPAISKPSTPAASSDHPADETKELPTLARLGLGAYRHAQPHFSFKKSSQDDLAESQESQAKFSEEQPEANAPHVKPKAPSSNKIVENNPRSTMQQTQEPSRTSFGPAAKSNKESSVPVKEPDSKPEAKAPSMQLNPRLWMPLVAGALAFVGTLLVVRSRDNPTDRDPVVYEVKEYEVKEGDTLSNISKRVGKKNWDELVRLNPTIANPDLIYPSERLKLSS